MIVNPLTHGILIGMGICVDQCTVFCIQALSGTSLNQRTRPIGLAPLKLATTVVTKLYLGIM